MTACTPQSHRSGEPSNNGAAVAPPGPEGLSRRKVPSSSAETLALARDRNPSRRPRRRSDPDIPFWQSYWFLALLLLVAFGFLAISVSLFLSLDLPDSSPSPDPDSAVPDADEGVEITFGSVIKLMHERTKFRLHSHEVPYGSGSGQQSVTGFPNVDDSNSYWIVRPQPDSSAKQGDPIPNGAIIRLQHMRTRKWLHSHLHPSPITGNLEVSCFGGDSQSDTGDFWQLEIVGARKIWRQDQRIRLRHIDTGGYLHTHNKKYTRIAGGQQEVCGVGDKLPDNVWLAAEGVYLPANGNK
uniref:MIR domain-containing protein n=1 Tax=Ananas comosus var. bracteatus TaxID=296719 RepID=A0A6V7QAM2_ANACO|nr:unnamed protein product [Ananas comosus var. bracteatus]